MNANYTSSPSASLFHSYCLARRKSWPDKTWGWEEVLDHSQGQDHTWNRNTEGLSLLELLCQERFSLGTTGKDRCWSVQVSKRMAFLAVLQESEGAEKTFYHLKARSFAAVTPPPVWKYWENQVRMPTTLRFHGVVLLSPWSVQEQQFWSPDLHHLHFSWKLTTETSRLHWNIHQSLPRVIRTFVLGACRQLTQERVLPPAAVPWSHSCPFHLLSPK